jgi:hypothetical protein
MSFFMFADIEVCPVCETPVDLLSGPSKTVVIRRYTVQPWMDHITIRCTECGNRWRKFAIRRGRHKRLKQANVQIVRKRFAAPEVVADFEKQFNITGLKSRTLTQREERLVAFYRYVIEREHPENPKGD